MGSGCLKLFENSFLFLKTREQEKERIRLVSFFFFFFFFFFWKTQKTLKQFSENIKKMFAMFSKIIVKNNFQKQIETYT